MSGTPCAWCGRALTGRFDIDFVIAAAKEGPPNASSALTFRTEAIPDVWKSKTVYVHKACFTPHMHLQHASPEAREAVAALRESLIANHDLQVASAQSAHREADLARRERDAAVEQAASFLPDEAVRSDYLTERGLGWLARLAPRYGELVKVLRWAEAIASDDDDRECLGCSTPDFEPHDARCEVAALLFILDASWAAGEVERAEAVAREHQERLRGLHEVRNTPTVNRDTLGERRRGPFSTNTAQYRAGLAVTSEELARIRETVTPLEGTIEEFAMARLYGVDLHLVDPKEPKK